MVYCIAQRTLLNVVWRSGGKGSLGENKFSSVQQLSHVQLFATPWTTAHQASLSINSSQSLLKLMCIESVKPSNHLILCHLLLFLPSIFPSIRVFSNESALHIRWPKCWSFSFNISPSNEHSGLIYFRMDLLAVQGTHKSLLQHHSSKASMLQRSAFFIALLSHPYMTSGKIRTVMEFGMDMYRVLYLKWITKNGLLYSTEDSAQCCVEVWREGEFGGE